MIQIYELKPLINYISEILSPQSKIIVMGNREIIVKCFGSVYYFTIKDNGLAYLFSEREWEDVKHLYEQGEDYD